MKAIWQLAARLWGPIADTLQLAEGIVSALAHWHPCPWVDWLDGNVIVVVGGIIILCVLVALLRKYWPTPLGRTIRWYSPDKGQGLPS